MGAAASAASAWILACTSVVMSASLRAREHAISPKVTTSIDINKTSQRLVFIGTPLRPVAKGNWSPDIIRYWVAVPGNGKTSVRDGFVAPSFKHDYVARRLRRDRL